MAPAGLARVSGFTAEATGFARAYAGATARRTMTQHLYELGRLTPPDVPGELVALTDDLVDLTDRWYLDFGAETGQPTRPDSAEKKRRLVRAGRELVVAGGRHAGLHGGPQPRGRRRDPDRFPAGRRVDGLAPGILSGH